MTEKEKTLAPLCNRAYACRSAHTYCQPAFSIDENKFYFSAQVDQGDGDCLYKKKYGFLHTCDCPVRLEIYQKYRI